MYFGNDLKREKCRRFIENKCRVERNVMDVAIEIRIFLKDVEDSIAVIKCFFYNYENPNNYTNKDDSLHIKSLVVEDDFIQGGLATYLMKEVILFAESKRFKNISVYPSACTSLISQSNLEMFYKNFAFNTRWKKNKKIEFMSILD